MPTALQHYAPKRRNFYPVQVLRALDGCNPLALEPAQSAALAYFMRGARRRGHAIAIINARSDLSAISKATHEQRRAVMDNTNLRIFLRVPSEA
jgi:hypothetical protein